MMRVICFAATRGSGVGYLLICHLADNFLFKVQLTPSRARARVFQDGSRLLLLASDEQKASSLSHSHLKP